MIGYERQCQWLLVAFPPEFRRDRGADLVGALVDDATPDAGWVPVRTALDVVRAGTGLRVFRAGAARSVGASASQSIALAALIGLGVQAALAIASMVYFAEHGLVFFLPTDTNPGFDTWGTWGAWGALRLGTWVALAVVSSAAFTAAARGAWRIAAGFGLAASVYLIGVAVWLAASVPPAPDGVRYEEFIATPGFLAIGAIAATCATITAYRSRRQSRSPRTWWWLAPSAALAILLSLVGDGNAVNGTYLNNQSVSASYPPQGGIMTVFQVLFACAVIIAVLWSRLDPRAGWAIAVLSIPFIAYQVSDLTIGNFYYGHLYQPGWETALPLILACTSLALLVATSVRTNLRLHRG